MMTKKGSTKIVNFITHGAGVLVQGRGHILLSENALFLKISSSLLPGIEQTNLIYVLVYTSAWIRQVKFKAIMAKECSSKIVNFITIWAEGLMLGRGYISHHSEYALQYTSHWLLLY